MDPLSYWLLVKVTFKGLQRQLAKPVVKKEPFTVEMLDLIARNANESGTLEDLRLATACLLGYSGYLHFTEIISLCPCDFTVMQDMMRIKIIKSNC